MSNQTTTITFFRYAGLKNQFWAFSNMQFGHKPLSNVDGLEFYKLMGSGKGSGFNPFPDWSTYCLLQVWESDKHATDYFKEDISFKTYQKYTCQIWTIYMKAIQAHGAWSGRNPFTTSTELDDQLSEVAVITRAQIKFKNLIEFWRFVPKSRKQLSLNKGLLFTKGIGELPVMQMATFSLWKNKKAIAEFAYQSKEHRQAIEKTKQLNWYSEELFSRFQPYRYEGNWEGNKLP